jgi:acyl-coenzyme A thioesterase PaaI-like protein
MAVSENTLKWAMRFYPSLFFQRIWVTKFEKGFRGVQVKINKSLLNRNYNNAIFGGTIFAAADPFYPVLFYQLLTIKGYKVIAWTKSSHIYFLKPGMTDLHFKIDISDNDIKMCEQELSAAGKYLKAHSLDIYDKNSQLCATVVSEVYVRDLNYSGSNNNE